MSASSELTNRIVELLRERQSEGMRRCDLRRKLGLHSSPGQTAFREAFRSLLADGVVVKRRRGRYVLADSARLLPGTISVHSRGFGFVTPEHDGPDIFVPPKALNSAISGDRVLVQVTDDGDDRGPVGSVHRIVDRTHSVLTGQLIDTDGRLQVRPLRRSLPESIPLAVSADGGEDVAATPGDWVVVRLLPQHGPREPLRAEFVRRIGAGNSIAGDLDAVISEYGLETEYSDAENAAVVELAPLSVARASCEQLVVLTIDPEDAADFDDGLSAQPGSRADTLLVGVHIADVAAFVERDSALDLAARSRGFTSYLPGRTLPMLPALLSADRCSLIEGEPRLAHSVFLEVNTSTGELLSTRRARTLVKVARRLSFDDVQEFLAGDAPDSLPGPVTECLSRLGEVYRAMRRRRAEEEAFLAVATAETRVRCAGQPPQVVGITRVEQGPAHALVEEFMLAANSAVAAELAERAIPALFRVHDEPKPGSLEEFRDSARRTLGGRVGNLRDRGQLNAFLEELHRSPMCDVVISSFLSALQRAVYASVCAEHYGLGKACYCHFTSPIRRYPDLVVHQQLLASDRGLALRSQDDCQELAEHCTALESNVDEAYYAAVDRLKLRYIRELSRSESGLFYEGLVARAVTDGLVVYVRELCTYGLVPKERLGGEPFRLDRKSAVLRGGRSGKTFKCGDFIYVQVRNADVTRGTLQLEPVRPRL